MSPSNYHGVSRHSSKEAHHFYPQNDGLKIQHSQGNQKQKIPECLKGRSRHLTFTEYVPHFEPFNNFGIIHNYTMYYIITIQFSYLVN
jgi:hypothetical protein